MNHRHHHQTDDVVSELYRRAPTPEPPAALDAQILALAQGQQTISPLPQQFHRRWQVPLSLAAVLVLAVTLIPLLRQQLPGGATSSPVSPLSEHVDAPATVPVPSADETLYPPEPAAGAVSNNVIQQQRRERASPAPSAQNVPPVQASPEPRLEVTTSTTPVEVELPSVAIEPASLAPSEAAAMAPSSPPTDQAPARTADFTDPERWLTWIRLLHRQGRENEAQAELDAFRRQFPNYSLEGLELPLESSSEP